MGPQEGQGKSVVLIRSLCWFDGRFNGVSFALSLGQDLTPSRRGKSNLDIQFFRMYLHRFSQMAVDLYRWFFRSNISEINCVQTFFTKTIETLPLGMCLWHSPHCLLHKLGENYHRMQSFYTDYLDISFCRAIFNMCMYSQRDSHNFCSMLNEIKDALSKMCKNISKFFATWLKATYDFGYIIFMWTNIILFFYHRGTRLKFLLLQA